VFFFWWSEREEGDGAWSVGGGRCSRVARARVGMSRWVEVEIEVGDKGALGMAESGLLHCCRVIPEMDVELDVDGG